MHGFIVRKGYNVFVNRPQDYSSFSMDMQHVNSTRKSFSPVLSDEREALDEVSCRVKEMNVPLLALLRVMKEKTKN